MTRDGARFSVEIDVAKMPSFNRPLPLRDGNWDIFVRRAGAATAGLITPAYDHARLADITGEKVGIGPKNYRFTTSGYDAPLIVAKPALKLSEQGRFQRKALRSAYYPLQQKLPLRDSVVFISWKGKQCGDNPLGIAEELRRRGDEPRAHLGGQRLVGARAGECPRGTAPDRGLLRGAGPLPLHDRQRRHASRSTTSAKARSTCRPGTARR